jgi:transcriptional regulator with XRE-family HTH domain
VDIVNLGQRIKLAREHAGLSQKDLVQRIEELFPDSPITQQAISKLERSTTAIRSRVTVQLAFVCEVNPMWLATGVGPAPGEKVAEPVAPYIARSGMNKMGHLTELLDELLPPNLYAISTGTRMALIEAMAGYVKPDGRLDMAKIVTLVRPIKKDHLGRGSGHGTLQRKHSKKSV